MKKWTMVVAVIMLLLCLLVVAGCLHVDIGNMRR